MSKMFTVFDESNFVAKKILKKNSVPSLEKAFKNRLFLSKRERLRHLTLGTTFEKTGRSVMFHYLRYNFRIMTLRKMLIYSVILTMEIKLY